ncbi:hypothetical protein BIW11_01433 [Tropilaelaps mercedesae]|uniref:RING-type domain-containing protein n=1 Tax=Tropilaelaps mercedesae TaxID=418985 RepID=A0A1V9XE19_9ACAR|nr:hypothetical protein BIW11_01433 [Tropilaelaps mercedesae]
MVRVAVLGCGVLGSKIVGDLVYHGHEVRAYDSNSEALDKLLLRLAEDTKILRKDGLLNQPNFVGGVLCMSRLEEAVREADFVFEAIIEDLSSKSELVAQVSHLCPATAIIGSSSMHLNIDSIFERAAGKDRCLGVRFLFPVFTVSEVELQMTEDTSPECVTFVREFLERMGKTAFLRAGNLPLVLSEAQREYRWVTRVHIFQQTARRRPPLLVPDLTHHESLERVLNSELMDGLTQSREKDCVVCMDEERNCVLHPCHHLCLCATCGKMLLKRQDACPICRKKISSIFRIFYA